MPVRKESEGIQMELRFLFLGQLDRFFLLQVALKGIKLIISDHQTFAIGQQDNIILIFFSSTPSCPENTTDRNNYFYARSLRAPATNKGKDTNPGEGRGQHSTMVSLLAHGPSYSGIDSQRSPKNFRGKKLSMLPRFTLDQLFFLKREQNDIIPT